MCGRFDVDLSNREIDRLISQLPPGSPQIKIGEVFPTNIALTLILQDGAPAPEAMVWGFPRWKGNGVIINARTESALTKPMFSNALLAHPAVIPATGFYEWRANGRLKQKEKMIFTDPACELLYLAGFWNDFPKEEMPKRFTILTAEANAFMREYHDRMPVMMRQHEILPWLKGVNRAEILARPQMELKAAVV